MQNNNIIALKTLETIKIGGRVINFINANCYVIGGKLLITKRDYLDLLNIINEEIKELFINTSGDAVIPADLEDIISSAQKFNAALTDFATNVKKSLYNIIEKPILAYKFDEKMAKLSKDFISEIAECFDIKYEDFVVYILFAKKDLI